MSNLPRQNSNSGSPSSCNDDEYGWLGVAQADFHARAYGPEYLELARRELIILCRRWDNDPGWAYGVRCEDGERGWFPAGHFDPHYENGPTKVRVSVPILGFGVSSSSMCSLWVKATRSVVK